MKKVSLGIAVALSLTLVFSAAFSQKVLFESFGPGDVPSLDPSVATDTSSIQIVTELFPGLTRLDEESVELQDGVASYSVSDDGMTYTFNIMPDISWVRYDGNEVVQVTDDAGDVRTLSANDFVFGWRRSVDPASSDYYGSVMAPWVVNGSAIYDGDEEDITSLGVKATDDLTLEVSVTQPAAFLPNIFGMWMATAQPSWLIEEYGDFWTEDDAIQSYGPFALKEWLHDESMTIIKNPFWKGTDSIPASKIDEVNFTMLEASAQLANFEAGLLDISDVPSDDIDRLKSTPEYRVGPGSCTYYYGFNTTKAPMDDPRMRRAFSFAIERQAIIDNILKAGQQPAGFFSRPNLVGAPSQEDFPDLAARSDAEFAKAELQSYLDEKGIGLDDLPQIIMMHNESESHARIAQAAQQMWSENLGIDVDIQTQEWAVYLETTREDPPHIFRLGWCLDYPDANNFLYDVFHSSTNPRNQMNNAEFDALVEEAAAESDPAVRRVIYAQAEGILVNSFAGTAPIYYYTFSDLTSDRVSRTYSQIGNEYYEKWDINE